VYAEPAEMALLGLELETGRTHQIRVHLQAIGHPVVGDRDYGGERGRIRTPRMFLHAEHLAFVHPTTGAALSFDAPLPPDLASVLAHLTPA
jgi:23S rRNA pseudouridine1911/1915/1917 synthase